MVRLMVVIILLVDKLLHHLGWFNHKSDWFTGGFTGSIVHDAEVQPSWPTTSLACLVSSLQEQTPRQAREVLKCPFGQGNWGA